MATIIDGKAIAAAVRADVAADVAALKEKGIVPGLAVIIVGSDPASRVYVNNKKKACAEAGIYSEEFALPEDTTQDELLALVESLNNRSDINGILCQLPLPAHLEEKAVIEAISLRKDVDAFHAANVGHIMIGDYHFLPCTPARVMEHPHLRRRQSDAVRLVQRLGHVVQQLRQPLVERLDRAAGLVQKGIRFPQNIAYCHGQFILSVRAFRAERLYTVYVGFIFFKACPQD